MRRWLIASCSCAIVNSLKWVGASREPCADPSATAAATISRVLQATMSGPFAVKDMQPLLSIRVVGGKGPDGAGHLCRFTSGSKSEPQERRDGLVSLRRAGRSRREMQAGESVAVLTKRVFRYRPAR